MADFDNISNGLLNDCENLEIFGDDSSKVMTLSVTLDGVNTDFVFCDYSDKQFLVITQFQKIGTLISVTKCSAQNLGGVNDMYEIKTISGLDSEEYHLVARYLAQQLNIYKPVLFGICLKDTSLRILNSICKVLKESFFEAES